MNVLKGILSESKDYYINAKAKIEKRLASLPVGNIKKRKIAGKIYYYLQHRVGNRVQHQYMGKNEPVDIAKQLSERKALKSELKKVHEALQMLSPLAELLR